jgi:hypothetical protein
VVGAAAGGRRGKGAPSSFAASAVVAAVRSGRCRRRAPRPWSLAAAPWRRSGARGQQRKRGPELLCDRPLPELHPNRHFPFPQDALPPSCVHRPSRTHGHDYCVELRHSWRKQSQRPGELFLIWPLLAL